MKGRVVDFLRYGGKCRLTLDLESDFPEADKLSDVSVTIKKYHEKRTLQANAYLWVLVTEIANKLRYSKEEVYIDMLRRYGQGGAVSVKKKYAERFERSQPYHEKLGESDLNGETFVHYRFFVGSHEYDRIEFSILLDGVVSEAKDLGIETRSPEEIESLLKAYGT